MEKLDFDDLLIEPASATSIESRKACGLYQDTGYLPLITAPMDTVIDNDNMGVFDDLDIITCLPRGLKNPNGFESYSLKEFNDEFLNSNLRTDGKYLIDIANGHMTSLCETIQTVKKHHPTMTIMAGNIANPATYIALSNAGADYVRCGIGNGAGCSTTLQTGVGYPMASLISECYEASLSLDKPALIVADGGMQKYADIIKALALGADYVMVGSLFNKAIESCGDNYLWGKIKVSQHIAELAYASKIPVYKKFRGMSTKEVQKKWGKETFTTSEGVIRFRKVEYTLAGWTRNFKDYLSSAMSYTNAGNLSEFIGQVKLNRITNNAYNRFKK